MKEILFVIIIFQIATTGFSQQKNYTLKDLATFSKSQYGFKQSGGKINEYYGDIECTSFEKGSFDFNVGCGRGGDIISVTIMPSTSKKNTFDMLLPKGSDYYGKQNISDKKIGELTIISQNEIKGSIKLCLEKDASCCGEEGEIFTLMKIK